MIERVVITGASSGIGAACVESFKMAGAEVLGLDKDDSSEADDHLQIDLGDPECGRWLVRFCDGRPVDGLVNNAGIGLDKLAVDTNSEEFDRVIGVNLRAPYILASALYPALALRGGFIVNVASVHAVATSRLVSAYAASKGGLVALTRALAVEWAPEVRVNAVLPGAVETDMLIDGLSRTESSLGDMAVRHPLGRVGRPREIAEAVMFLATNSFTTGTLVTVDGGASARLSTE